MQVVSPELIKGKKVLLRLDLDVVLKDGRVEGNFRLQSALPTLKLCLESAESVVAMGHIGRPNGRVDEKLSVEPVYNWLRDQDLSGELESGKLRLLENLRFERGEEDCDEEYAKELAALGDFFVNEAFAAFHPAASTTILPNLLPHAAGLRFAAEVEEMEKIRRNHPDPLVVIIGGAKLEDKLPAVNAMSGIAGAVLVGGKIAGEIVKMGRLNPNVFVGQLNEGGTDVTPETVANWEKMIKAAKMIVWNGPLGYIEDSKNDQTRRLAEMILNSDAETVIGGGDTVTFLDSLGLLDKFSFVSTGGGAMLELLTKGTLPTIEALE